MDDKSTQTTAIMPYLFFDGRCEEAIEFYKKAVGAKPDMLMRFRENPEPCPPEMVPDGDGNKVMHASFTIKGAMIMASDGCGSGDPFKGFSLSYSAADEKEARRVFDNLSKDGKADMPLGKTFFSPCFGMLTDKFGLSWMVIVPGEMA